MALPILKGLVANYGKLGYQVWHRPLKMASLVYEREIGAGDLQRPNSLLCFLACHVILMVHTERAASP